MDCVRGFVNIPISKDLPASTHRLDLLSVGVVMVALVSVVSGLLLLPSQGLSILFLDCLVND